MKKKDEIIWKNAWRLAQTKGWSKEDLAEKMKVRITSLNNIINGTKGIGPQMLEKIKLALGVDEDVLMVPLPIDDGTSTDIGNIS